jgi:hypothetical protein
VKTNSIFLSHSHEDKAFAKRLASDMQSAGLIVWVDEAEINIGESLLERIRVGIDNVDYLAVILSPESVQSEWVQHEVEQAMNQQIQGRQIMVLPLLYKACTLPPCLQGKKYGDFTRPDRYPTALEELLRQFGLTPSIVRKKYQGYPFIGGATRYRDLTDDARFLLKQSTKYDGQLIQTNWDDLHIRRLDLNAHKGGPIINVNSEQESLKWESALHILEEHWLIQHIADRPGYKAYMITPDGFDLVKFIE